jgi:hypothetical protein
VFDVARLAQALIAWLDDCGIRTANAGRELVGLPDRTARAGHSLEGINLTRPSESVAVGGATIDVPGVARDGALVPGTEVRADVAIQEKRHSKARFSQTELAEAAMMSWNTRLCYWHLRCPRFTGHLVGERGDHAMAG